jgi:uncharacterized protein
MPDHLVEFFSSPTLDERLTWLNPPERFEVKKGRLYLYPDSKTDFWQKTHYGFSVDNGHFLYTQIEGDFTLSTKISFHPAHQYDQAGLMVRISPDCWLKTSVEYEVDEPGKLGAVVTTHGFSDWSTQEFHSNRNVLEYQITREGDDYRVEYCQDGHSWKQIRLAHLPNPGHEPVMAGIYSCSPIESGFEAVFDYIKIALPIPKDAPVTLREIEANNLDAILRLSETLSDSHRRMVATNAVSIAQANYSKYAWFRGIYAGEDPVGFIMVYIGPDEDESNNEEVFFLWRLMVAEPYQGRGYGRKALEQVIQMAKERGAKELLTSCGEGEGSPEGFYRRLGFESTGRYGGEELILRIGLFD